MNHGQKKQKRLSLKTETLRVLRGQELGQVQGGGVWVSAFCRPTTCNCGAY